MKSDARKATDKKVIVKEGPGDHDILTRTLFGESEVGDVADAEAISNVVLRRVALPNWPNTVSGVCLQPKAFSCWNDAEHGRERIMAATGKEPWFKTCADIARKALNGKLTDKTNGATHYYATYIKPPKWAKGKTPCYETPAGKYNHLFFNDIDTPPPKSAADALNQTKPLSQSRTVRGAQAGASVGVVATATGVLAEIEPAIPALDWVSRNLTTALMLVGIAAVLAACYVAYARWEDRNSGVR